MKDVVFYLASSEIILIGRSFRFYIRGGRGFLLGLCYHGWVEPVLCVFFFPQIEYSRRVIFQKFSALLVYSFLVLLAREAFVRVLYTSVDISICQILHLQAWNIWGKMNKQRNKNPNKSNNASLCHSLGPVVPRKSFFFFLPSDCTYIWYVIPGILSGT